MKTLNDWLHPSKKVPPGPFDMFLFHSQWRYQEVQKVMPTSAVTITILRDPVDTFESGYSYFGRAPKVLRYLKHSLIVACIRGTFSYNLTFCQHYCFRTLIVMLRPRWNEP